MRSIVALLLVATTLGGCSQLPGRQGFVADPTLVASVKPGIDNKASVQGTLGRPTFVGQFDSNDWYYVSRETKQYVFRLPRPSAQSILRVQFDPNGNVRAVERTGLERVADIRPVGDKTETRGRNRGFFEEIFGNIGSVGSVGRGGGTADNPGGQ